MGLVGAMIHYVWDNISYPLDMQGTGNPTDVPFAALFPLLGVGNKYQLIEAVLQYFHFFVVDTLKSFAGPD